MDASGCTPCGNASGSVTLVQGYQKLFYVNLFFEDQKLPFDLTNVAALSLAFPAADSLAVSPIVLDLTTGVSIVGAPGAGRIAVLVSEAKSALIKVNPSPGQGQDLQVEVRVGSGGNASVPVAGTTVFVLKGALDVQTAPYGTVIP